MLNLWNRPNITAPGLTFHPVASGSSPEVVQDACCGLPERSTANVLSCKFAAKVRKVWKGGQDYKPFVFEPVWEFALCDLCIFLLTQDTRLLTWSCLKRGGGRIALNDCLSFPSKTRQGFLQTNQACVFSLAVFKSRFRVITGSHKYYSKDLVRPVQYQQAYPIHRNSDPCREESSGAGPKH